MRTIKSQRGITLLGFLIILMLAAFFAYLGMRLVPVYLEDYSVKKCLQELTEEPGIGQKTPEQIKDALFRKFYISYVTTPKAKDLKVVREGNSYTAQMKYEARGPLFYNLEYIASFDHTVKLGH